MSPSLYKVLHILGVLLSFAALGALIFQAMVGPREKNAASKLAGMTHGIALLLILISGFGMLAKLGLGFPGWVWIKILIWLLIGASIALIRRLPGLARVFWLAWPLLGAFAAYLAIYKPVF